MPRESHGSGGRLEEETGQPIPGPVRLIPEKALEVKLFKNSSAQDQPVCLYHDIEIR